MLPAILLWMNIIQSTFCFLCFSILAFLPWNIWLTIFICLNQVSVGNYSIINIVIIYFSIVWYLEIRKGNGEGNRGNRSPAGYGCAACAISFCLPLVILCLFSCLISKHSLQWWYKHLMLCCASDSNALIPFLFLTFLALFLFLIGLCYPICTNPNTILPG